MGLPRDYPKVKLVLSLLGLGTFLAATILMPTLPMAVKPILDEYKRRQREKDLKEWNRFNMPRLRQTLKRLYQQKIIEIEQQDGMATIKLTDRGRVKFLQYKMEEMMVEKPPRWDGKWRLIIYDVEKKKKFASDSFRRLLKKMEILRLQKSVYLTPYPCEEQIEFLRQYFGIGKDVLYLVVQKLENDSVYEKYFGI